MQRPVSHVLATTASRSPQRKAISIVTVGILHVALIAALLAGLKPVVVKIIPHPVDIFFAKDVTPPFEPPPPPNVALREPAADPVSPPTWTTKDPASDRQITVAHVDRPPGPVGPVTAVLPTSLQSLAQTHTTPPYPPLSRRLGEEGKVGLHIRVAPDGRVIDAAVARSSGVERLDDAARRWVLAHWRYRPATKDGKPIAAETEAVVVFNLKTASR